MSRTFGCERYADAVRRIKRSGSELRSLPMTSSHNLESCMRIPIYSGRVFRHEAGHRSDLKPSTIPK